MSKEFGVNFKQWLYPTIHSTKMELCDVSFVEIVREIEFSQDDTTEGKFHNRYIVARISEPIFDPKTADKGIEKNLHSQDLCFYGGKYWAYENEEMQTTPNQARPKIIMRDNKQFFMPEVEND
jgi:hypothetical protein